MIPLAARRRAMLAADAVDVCSCREAAILGGIVRSVISCGNVHAGWVSTYTRDIIVAFNLVGVDRTPPGLAEIATVLSRFEESYSQPFT